MTEMNVRTGKLELFLSLNCKKNKKRWLYGVMGVIGVNNLSKYLGIELGKLKEKKEFFQPVINKLQNRVARWKAKLLSQASRLTLLKANLESIPIYTLSCYKALVNVCKRIDLWTWKSIMEGKEICKKDLDVQIRNGEYVGIIQGKIQLLIEQNRGECIPIKELFYHTTHNWKWERVSLLQD
ncbi:hypothetical protein PTKIN_Ptkin09bG0052500 [Pterospermum kingtungense]